MARKGINDLRDQQNRIVNALRDRVSKEFRRRYKSIVDNYNKNYKNPEYRKAYIDARNEFAKSDVVKTYQRRAKSAEDATNRYIASIRSSNGYKGLVTARKEAQDAFRESRNYRDYGATDRYAETANDLADEP